jgi:hypothetical protein
LIVDRTFWNHTKSPYEMYSLLLEEPRIPKEQMARKLKVNKNTIYSWYDEAVEKRIIILPVLRRKSFVNFREYIYFLNVEHPHLLYEELQLNTDILYYCVQTGFANFQIYSKVPLDLEGEIILEGIRSDYIVTTPVECTFEQSIQKIKRKLEKLGVYKENSSPLKIRQERYSPWDEKDEEIFWAVRNEMRKPFREIIREYDTYADKVLKWFRRCNEFGHIVTMYFPEGEGSYLPSLYSIKTEHDNVLIDIFSCLPTSSVFYRVDDRLIMLIHLPYLLDARLLARRVLSILKKRELVDDYTNSIVEYGYRQ